MVKQFIIVFVLLIAARAQVRSQGNAQFNIMNAGNGFVNLSGKEYRYYIH